jgi:hypothetical protein
MALDYVLGGILNNNLQRTANLSFNSSLLYLDVVGNRIGINTSNPTSTLDIFGDVMVNGNINVSGLYIGNIAIHANGTISVDNDRISNLGAPIYETDAATKEYVDDIVGNISNSNLIIANTTISTPFTSGNITLVPTGIGQVYITGSGDLSANSIYASEKLVALDVYANSINVATNVVAQTFYGDGSQLSNLNIGNLVLSNIASDVIPSVTNLYNVGNSLRQWREVWVSSNLYVGSTRIYSSANTLHYGNSNVVVQNNVGLVSIQTLTCSNSVTANYFIGDGSNLSNINIANVIGGYSNANVANYLPVYNGDIDADVVTANYFIGDGSNLSNISVVGDYSNANVANYLPIYNGDIVAGIVVANEVRTNTISTNDGVLYLDPMNDDSTAGLVEVLGDFDVAGLTTFASDVLIAGDIIPIANGVYSLGNLTNQWNELWVGNSTIYIGNIPLSTAGNGDLYVNNRPVLTESNTGDISVSAVTANGDISTTGFFIGDGSYITNLPLGNYSNANVANYLPTYSGSITANNVTAQSVTIGSSFTKSFIANSSSLGSVVLASIAIGDYHSFAFNVTATDVVGNNCEVTKIIAATVNGIVDYASYGSITIGTSVAVFSVIPNSGNIELIAAPDTANLVEYSVVVSNYS